MSYKLAEGTAIDFVAIKVKDIEAEIAFYKSVLGLNLLREENGMAFIGIKEQKKALLCLVEQVDGLPSQTSHNGLFYFAIRVPNRQDLAEIYQHLMKLKYPLQAVSDHGHSEMLYLQDPEFNGIKIYWDKPKSAWDYHVEGGFDSVIRHLDTEELVKEAKAEFTHMPNDTRMGHVHLNVEDLEISQDFYENILGLHLTSAKFPSVRYLAVGDYHQHISMNTFNKVKAADNSDEHLGLDFIAFKIDDVEVIRDLDAHLAAINADYFYNKGKKVLQIDDPNGIHVWFHLYDIKK